MRESIKAIVYKHAEEFRYLVVGLANTALFFLFYTLLVETAGLNYLVVNFSLWIISVVCVFFANKYIVFRSYDKEKTASEAASFFASRLFSSVIDMLLLWLQVDIFGFHELMAKIICAAVVTIINWILSKLFIFTKG